jgi:membrane protease subunit HflK
VRKLGAILIIVIIGYLQTGLAQVRPGERAVVRRFGRVIAKPGPGLWIGLPYGFERVDRVPIEMVRSVRVGINPKEEDADDAAPVGQLLTGDHNVVDVQVLIDYAIKEDQLEDFVVNADQAERILAQLAEAALSEWVAGKPVDEVLLRGKVELAGFLTARLGERLAPYQLGMVIQGASVVYVAPPKDVKPSFDEVNSAQTAIGTRQQEAKQEAARRLREVDAERDRIERMASAYASEQILLARAEAEAFEKRLRQYQILRQTNPHVLSSIWWEEMSKLFTQMKASGRIDLLDNHLGGDGLDITVAPALPKKR